MTFSFILTTSNFDLIPSRYSEFHQKRHISAYCSKRLLLSRHSLIEYLVACSLIWSMRIFQNCLLNGESRKTQQKLFIAEVGFWSFFFCTKDLKLTSHLQDTGHQMIYFEHPDAALFKRMHDETPLDRVVPIPMRKCPASENSVSELNDRTWLDSLVVVPREQGTGPILEV